MDDIALLLTETNNSPACQDPATTPAPEPAPDPATARGDRGDLDDAELTAWLDLAG
jgi:hypothetical protein